MWLLWLWATVGIVAHVQTQRVCGSTVAVFAKTAGTGERPTRLFEPELRVLGSRIIVPQESLRNATTALKKYAVQRYYETKGYCMHSTYAGMS